ncbi:TonB-dependent receptor [Prevotella aurantiaca]|uniref:TonB-dependent receptor n=1 Tax=Prevotella aurantiaca TaxID=596085 RepID=UPI0028EFD361|nr:TonB-dependent receptor [Prevotella aurantiaca]
MTTNITTKLRTVTTVIALTCFLTGAVAQVKNEEKSEGKQKDEDNRNVMLNAANANGPREIQIGLPMSDVNVLENGLPITYATNPRSVNSIWRSDASLEHVGLLKISETAITTGNIGYAVNSYTKLGKEGFHGTLNYKTNHFGLQEFSLNVNGGFGNNWFYSTSMYQDFDPGTFKIKSSQLQDRTQIYKASITKRYHNNRGEFTAMYHYSNSHPVYNYATQSAPFIYVGDGSVKEYGKFKLGTTSYLPTDGNIVYRDMKTGELKETSMYDAIANRSSEFSLMNNYNWDNGLSWKIAIRYDHAHGALVFQTPMSLIKVKNDPAYQYVMPSINGGTTPYTNGDYVQSRMSCLNSGDINEFLLTSELQKKITTSTLRLGFNEWYYNIDYRSNTSMYDQSVPADGSYPVRIYDTNKHSTYFYDFNKNASEYYRGHENKLALYMIHDWDVTPKLNLYYGFRIENQKLNGVNAAVKNAAGDYVGRFTDYYIGAIAPDGTTITPTPLDYNWFNYDVSAAATYKINNNFGLTGDFTYIVQHLRLESFAPATLPNTGKVSVPLGRIGFYYNNSWLTLTSLFSYISKTNNNSTLNLQHGSEIMAAPLTYDIKTWGWTTDLIARPLKGLDIHFLFTYQEPTYKKYETSITFSDGYVGKINATGNIVAEIPKVLIEFDPSYMLTKDLKLWASFRYFSKTYANINDAYYFSGHWETFGGVNWQVNDKLALGCTVVNFLNQTGAKGSIAGAELITKDDAKNISNVLMTGSYLRPFTVELSTSLKF